MNGFNEQNSDERRRRKGRPQVMRARWQRLHRFGLAPSARLDFIDLGAGAIDTSLWTNQGYIAGTYARATPATTVLSNGQVGSVASGVPRSYYDPTTLQYHGYLAEGARTNLLLRSEESDNAAWSKTDTVVTANAVVSPDGTATGGLLTEGTAGTARISQAVTGTPNVSYTFSVFLRYAGIPGTEWVRLSVFNGVNGANGWFNIQTGVVGTITAGGSGSGASGRVKAYLNVAGVRWYRFELTTSVGSGASAITAQVASAAANGNSSTVNNATRFQWGSQFENGVTFASSYIPTVGSTVTRNNDVLTYALGDWYNALAGTLLWEASVYNTDLGNQNTLGQLSDGTANERINNLFLNLTGAGNMFVVDGGVSQANVLTANVIAAQTVNKLVNAYEANNFISVLNGGAAARDTVGTLPTVTTLQIGTNNSTAFTFGAIRRFRYFPKCFQEEVMQRLSA